MMLMLTETKGFHLSKVVKTLDFNNQHRFSGDASTTHMNDLVLFPILLHSGTDSGQINDRPVSHMPKNTFREYRMSRIIYLHIEQHTRKPGSYITCSKTS